MKENELNETNEIKIDSEELISIEESTHLVWPNKHLSGYFWPLKERVPHFAKYLESMMNFTGEHPETLLIEFLYEAEKYDIATKKYLCDYFFPLLERNRNNQYFDQKRFFTGKIKTYFRKVLNELQKEHPSDYRYYKWYGMYLEYKDSIDKLNIANQLLNNTDEEVLIRIINLKVNSISKNVDQLLYTYLEKDVDKDIKELMVTVTLVSSIKSKPDKDRLIKICNDLTTRLTEYKISQLGSK